MALDVYFKEDIRDILASVYSMGGGLRQVALATGVDWYEVLELAFPTPEVIVSRPELPSGLDELRIDDFLAGRNAALHRPRRD